MNNYIEYTYDCEEMANALCSLAVDNLSSTKRDVEDALYQLTAIAENKYNSEYYRTLWRILQTITDNFTYDEFVKKGE